MAWGFGSMVNLCTENIQNNGQPLKPRGTLSVQGALGLASGPGRFLELQVAELKV